MTKKHMVLTGTLALSMVALGGCSSVRNSLGIDKDAPDEFAVVTRAPLEVPENLTLPPPSPGMPRPQESSTIQQAQKAVLGHKTSKSTKQSSTAEDMLLQKADADQADPNIRALVNKETQELHDRNKPVAEKLLNIGGNKDEPSATVVDAKEEHKRIRKNWEDGKSVLDGETPVIEE